MSDKVVMGSIPKKVFYACAQPHEVVVGCYWDINYDQYSPKPNTTVRAVPAFPLDFLDATMKRNALEWVRVANLNINRNSPPPAEFIEIDNDPIKQVKILSSYSMDTYKVLVDGYYLHLKEDVLMDTIIQAGIDPGGILKGEFIWAKIKSQMKLIRVGSELHRLILEFESKKDKKAIKKKSLEVGGIYQDKKKRRAVFLGYVNTNRYVTHGNVYAQTNLSALTYDIKTEKKSMLFYRLSSYNTREEQLKDLENLTAPSYNLILKKSHAYIEKIDYVALPADMISLVRRKSLNEMKMAIVNYANKGASGYISNLIWNFINSSPYFNMYPYKTPEVELFDMKKLLLFI